MRILVIGGTKFVGRHFVEHALLAGHDVTLFNRGISGPELFGATEHLVGNREHADDLAKIGGRMWDVVVDTCGYIPRHVRASAEATAASGAYLFVSSLSVYAEGGPAGQSEDAPLEAEPDASVETVSEESYGGLKVACERAAREAFGADRSLVIRPGLIVGPHDHSDRFTYWVRRLAAGGEVLAPAPPERPVQVIDVRDLATWMVLAIESNLRGAFNAIARPGPMAEVLDACNEAGDAGAHITWVDEAFLLEHKVGVWMELPLWIPLEANESFMTRDASRAFAAGLTTRPLADTVRDTLAWDSKREGGLAAGMDAARERELLDAWKRRV